MDELGKLFDVILTFDRLCTFDLEQPMPLRAVSLSTERRPEKVEL